MKIESVNKVVATEPFKEIAAKQKVTGGIAVIDNKVSLVPLKVVFSSPLFTAGDIVWVHGDVVSKHRWAKEVYRVNEHEFILVPEEFVMVAELQ